jgi:hypothetical protein
VVSLKPNNPTTIPSDGTERDPGVHPIRAHQYIRWRIELYSLESRLGVTRHGESLRKGGYEEADHDLTLLNADLAGLAKRIADSELSASTILGQAKAFQRIVGICEESESSNPTGQRQSTRPIVSEQKEEIEATIIRGELYLCNMKMAQNVQQSLSAVLYNSINKQDTDSMKTIAVVTLVFLPATFVSAIFSTGIFNFHASEPGDQPRTISKYGWVYLLVCLLSTTLTLVSWECWYRWGRVWLEKLKFSRIHSSGKRPRASFETGHKIIAPLMLTRRGVERSLPDNLYPKIPGEELRNTRFDPDIGFRYPINPGEDQRNYRFSSNTASNFRINDVIA